MTAPSVANFKLPVNRMPATFRLETRWATSHNQAPMMDPLDDTPSLPKLPFISADIALLATATFIAWQAPAPLSTSALIAMVACVALGALLLAVPFVADYGRRENRLLGERQDALAHLTSVATNAAEQAGIAAQGLHDIARQNAATLNEARSLPERWRELLATQTPPPAPAPPQEFGRELVALRKTVDALALRPTDSAPPRPTAQPIALPPDLLALPAAVAALAAQLDHLCHTLETPSAPAPPKEAKPARKPRAADPEVASLFATDEVLVDPPKPAPAAAPPPSSVADSDDPSPAVPPPAAPPPIVPVNRPKPAPSRPSVAPNAAASGVRICLTVTAYIGIGNKLFVRGTGAGLSAEKGKLLQFVSIGKWRWETDAAETPVTLTLWKNDEIPCTSVGALVLAPGETREVTANF